MPGRQYNAVTGFRYGFNGKEKDNKDGIVQYDYGFRIYDPRIVRFKSVDPLTKKYPFYSPYHFAGNTPIWATDLDGLEPNPTNTAVVNRIYEDAGGDKSYNKNKAKINGSEVTPNPTLYQYNNTRDEKQRFVNTTSASKIQDKPVTGEEFVSAMMGNFIKGVGPENYIFPKDGYVSSMLKNASIVKDAYESFFNKNVFNIGEGKPLEGFTAVGKYGLGLTMKALGNPLTVENFIGSARVTLTPVDANHVEVTVFNVTSLHSGDLGKEGWGGTYNYKSVVRDPSNKSPQPYSNISQIFKFTLPIDRGRALDAYEGYKKTIEQIKDNEKF